MFNLADIVIIGPPAREIGWFSGGSELDGVFGGLPPEASRSARRTLRAYVLERLQQSAACHRRGPMKSGGPQGGPYVAFPSGRDAI